MATRAARSIVFLLVLLGLGSFVLYRTLARPQPARPEAPTEAVVARTPDESAHTGDAPAPIPKQPSDGASAADVSATNRLQAGTSAELELADALWVTGVVKLPANTPLGEPVEVVATGKPFAHRAPHRASLASDGSFRVAFAAGTRTGRLDLEAPHLYLESASNVRPGVEPDGHVLEAKLGGRILGVVVPPASAPDAAEALAEARVEARLLSSSSRIRLVSSRIRPDRTFELAGLDANQRLQIDFESALWASSSLDSLRLAPGEDRHVELALRTGARLRGTVLDDQGQPVTGTGLKLVVGGRGGHFESDGSVGKDGSFDLRAVEPGTAKLSAIRPGYETASLELGEVGEGEVRSDLALVLRRGHSIAGRVTWPDGRPAAKVQVQVIAGAGSDAAVPSVVSVTTAADGTFRISGLAGRSQSITAFTMASRDAGGAQAGGADAPAEAGTRKLPRKIRWSAIARDVAVGAEGLELVLGKGATLHGRVVNDLGAPVRKFSVFAVLAGSDSRRDSRPISVSGRFEAEDGTFTLEGVTDGQWFLHAAATGHVESERTSVFVPRTESIGDLSLARVAVVRGIVRGSDGRPVEDMPVKCSRQVVREDGTNFSTSMLERTDARGRFAFSAVVPGECTLKAGPSREATSAPMTLTLAPGQVLDGLVLDLRRGARLTVEVAPSPGSEASGCKLSLIARPGGGAWREAMTDAAGIAVIEGLEPGEWEVTAKPDPQAVQELQRTSGQEEWKARMSLERSKKIELADGDDVRLRIEPNSAGRSIVVSGTVRRSGKELPDARIEAMQWRESTGWARFFARSDSSGFYSLAVDEPGGYRVSISNGGAAGALSRWHSVPDQPTCTLDLDSPGGAITGRVAVPEGTKIRSISLFLHFDDRYVPTDPGEVSASLMLEAPGEFRFDDLPRAFYRIDGWGTVESSDGRSRSAFCASRSALWLDDGATLADVTLSLEATGALAGVVHGTDGTPAVQALVQVIGAQAELESRSSTVTDEAGRYRLEGLAPGIWGVTASKERGVTREATPVQVVAGETAKADVHLAPGSGFSLTLRSPDGDVVYAALTVRDARSCERVRRQVRADSGEVLPCGVLPSGNYTLWAVDYFGRTLSKEFTMDGAADTALDLTFEER